MRHPARTALLLGIVLAGLPARGQEPAASEGPPAHGLLGVGAQLGMFSGTGLGLQVGTPAAGLRLGAGWAPALLAITDRSGADPKLKFYSGFLLAPDLYLRLATPRPTTSIGLQLGYRYSSLLGSGGAGGGYAQIAVGRSVDLLLAGGFFVFPGGEERLRDEKRLPDVEFGFPGPNVGFAISVGLLLFP